MTDINDNPPPLPDRLWFDSLSTDDLVQMCRQIEAAAFARGVVAGQAAMQGEIERLKAEDKNLYLQTLELRAKLKALEEQKPVAHVKHFMDGGRPYLAWHSTGYLKEGDHLYLAAGAKP